MAITYSPEEYIAALGNLTPLMRDEIGGMEGITDINGLTNIDNLNKFINSYTTNQGYNMPTAAPTTDSTFSSGLNYAQSIAGGQNVPSMIAPGVSYSSAMPQGFTQAQLNGTPLQTPVYQEPDDKSFFGTGIGGYSMPFDRHDPPVNKFGNGNDPINNPDPINNLDPINIIGGTKGFYGNPFDPIISIGGIGGGNMGEIPITPVGMSPQELAKASSQQELLNLLSSKDELAAVPSDDGVRNQYQVELDEYINKSPINMDTYKEELPIGSAFNLGMPSFRKFGR